MTKTGVLDRIGAVNLDLPDITPKAALLASFLKRITDHGTNRSTAPGKYSVSLAASVRATGHEVFWASDGRSEQTRARAEDGLTELKSVQELCAEAEGIVCICNPHVTEDVAQKVAGPVSAESTWTDIHATQFRFPAAIGALGNANGPHLALIRH